MSLFGYENPMLGIGLMGLGQNLSAMSQGRASHWGPYAALMMRQQEQQKQDEALRNARSALFGKGGTYQDDPTYAAMFDAAPEAMIAAHLRNMGPQDQKRYNVGGALVDAQGNEIYKAPEKPQYMRAGDDIVVIDPKTGEPRKVYGGERNPGPDVEGEGKLRKEFTALTKTYRDVRDAFGRIKVSGENPSPAGDMALIFNYMKMLDPGSVVRESEFALAAQSGDYGDRIQGLVNRVLNGQRLSEDVRRDFMTRSGALYAERTRQYERTRDQFRGIASQYGFDPMRSVPALELETGDGGAPPSRGLSGMSDEDLMRLYRGL